jgi:hypothetical protein
VVFSFRYLTIEPPLHNGFPGRIDTRDDSGSSMKDICRCTGWVHVWRGDGSFRSHEFRCVSSMVLAGAEAGTGNSALAHAILVRGNSLVHIRWSVCTLHQGWYKSDSLMRDVCISRKTSTLPWQMFQGCPNCLRNDESDVGCTLCGGMLGLRGGPCLGPPYRWCRELTRGHKLCFGFGLSYRSERLLLL